MNQSDTGPTRAEIEHSRPDPYASELGYEDSQLTIGGKDGHIWFQEPGATDAWISMNQGCVYDIATFATGEATHVTREYNQPGNQGNY